MLTRILVAVFCIAGGLGVIAQLPALNVYQETEVLRKSEQTVKVLAALDAKAKLLRTPTATPTVFSKGGATRTPSPTASVTKTPSSK